MIKAVLHFALDPEQIRTLIVCPVAIMIFCCAQPTVSVSANTADDIARSWSDARLRSCLCPGVGEVNFGQNCERVIGPNLQKLYGQAVNWDLHSFIRLLMPMMPCVMIFWTLCAGCYKPESWFISTWICTNQSLFNSLGPKIFRRVCRFPDWDTWSFFSQQLYDLLMVATLNFT